LDEKKFIAIELKSLFERDKRGLRQKELKWERWKRQIYNYTCETKYLVLTNYKKWYFFNAKDCISEDKCEPFYECDLLGFLADFKREGDLKELIIRREREAEKEDLDERFFRNLGEWVKILEEIDFEVSEAQKKEAIIGLINKFIFIDTLDDFQVIEPLWVRNYWNRCGEKIDDFLRSTNVHFFLKYDTELFKDDFITKVKEEESNIIKLRQSLKTVLGLSAWQGVSKEFKGITQYKFRNINEDIFGKAYEKYLASLRKERGIYYTPSYVTEYIVENTVGAVFDALLSEFKKELGVLSTVIAQKRKKEKEIERLKGRRIEREKRALLRNKLRKKLEELEKEEEKSNAALKDLAKRFIEIKILDPACGSGSFLIKAMRLIWDKYKKFKDVLKGYYGKIDFSIYNDLRELTKLNRSDRELISCIILRHIHGVDLDERALGVAKVNIWEEGVKLSPESFKEDRLPEDAIHILPNLEMNLRSGNSLVGLPEDLTMKYLQENHREEIIKLFRLREEYLNNPTKVEKIEEIEEIKDELRKELDGEFVKYLKERDLSLEILEGIKPFHWTLEFWFAFFDENGKALSEEERGFDVVVGNPPYGIVFNEDGKAFFEDRYFTFKRNNDIFVAFIQRSVGLLKDSGVFSFIIPNTFLIGPYFNGLKGHILDTTKIIKLLDFGINQVFDDPNVFNAIIVLQKEKNKEIRKNNIVELIDVFNAGELNANNFRILKRKQSDLIDFHWKTVNAVVKKVSEINPKLGDIGFVKDVGLNYWTKGRGKKRGKSIGSRILYAGKQRHENDIPYLKGGDIDRYWYEFNNHWLKHDYETHLDQEFDVFRYSSEYLDRDAKIIYRQTADKIIATIDEQQYYLDKTVHLTFNRIT